MVTSPAMHNPANPILLAYALGDLNAVTYWSCKKGERFELLLSIQIIQMLDLDVHLVLV